METRKLAMYNVLVDVQTRRGQSQNDDDSYVVTVPLCIRLMQDPESTPVDKASLPPTIHGVDALVAIIRAELIESLGLSSTCNNCGSVDHEGDMLRSKFMSVTESYKQLQTDYKQLKSDCDKLQQMIRTPPVREPIKSRTPPVQTEDPEDF